MASSRTLGKYLTPQQHQRLSIAEIHRLWNDELHRAAGRTPCKFNPSIVAEAFGTSKSEPNDVAKRLNEIKRFGKWQDAAGNLYENDCIDYDLIELIQKGELRAYPGKDSSAEPIRIDDVQGINLRPKTGKYFIDRDELGGFLFRQGHPLPKFWYRPQDEAIYRDRLAEQRESVREMREHLKMVISDNERLQQELLEPRAFMNPEHPFFAPELEAAVAVWLEMFEHKKTGDIVADKPKMALWLNANRAEQLGAQDKGISKAIDRIVTIANYRKTPGRPRTRKLT